MLNFVQLAIRYDIILKIESQQIEATVKNIKFKYNGIDLSALENFQ